MSNYSEVKKTGKNPKKPKPQRSGFTRFLLKLMGVLIVLSILAGIGGFIMLKWSEDKLAQPMPVDTMFNVKQGSSLHSVITQLSTANLIECEPCLRWHVRIFGGKNIKAGTYQFKGDMSSMDILNMLEKGEVAEFKITLVEGLTLDDWLKSLWAHPQIVKTIEGADRTARYAAVAQALELEEMHPEGLFLPETYTFAAETKDIEILRRAHQHFESVLAKLWETRQADLPLKTPYEAVILASIVEKETGQAYERPKIAGVFINRLNKDMRLETDPTVIYGIKEYAGNITRAHLREKTAYNTYTMKGLPPTPIASPSQAALEASLQPEATDAIFFVAKGDGSHVFSATLKAHNAAVREYQLKRRANYRSAPTAQ